MAIDYNAGINSIDVGAHDITYSGNQGPKSPDQEREMAFDDTPRFELKPLELLLEVGIEAIQSRLQTLTNLLVAELSNSGYQILSPRGESEWSGIVTFGSNIYDTEDLHQKLRQKQIIGAKRCGGIRISPHFYNTEEEVLRVIEAIPNH